MSRDIGAYVSALLVLLFELTASTVVLPRPPSSLNHIRHDQRELSARKAVEGKSLHGVQRNIDAARLDTEDYRYPNIYQQAFVFSLTSRMDPLSHPLILDPR